MAVAKISMDLIDTQKQYRIILVVMNYVNRDIKSLTSGDLIIKEKGKKEYSGSQSSALLLLPAICCY